jgi:uncharacterized cupin superfamily protein
MSETLRSSVLKVGRSDGPLVDQPINPAWILEGTPHARTSAWGESPDGTTSHWTWDCTPGRFRWYYECDESIVVVAGSVSIQVDDEPPVWLAVGDGAYFPAGHWVTWQVDDYVRKQAVVRVPVPRTMRYAVNGIGRRKHRLR